MYDAPFLCCFCILLRDSDPEIISTYILQLLQLHIHIIKKKKSNNHTPPHIWWQPLIINNCERQLYKSYCGAEQHM